MASKQTKWVVLAVAALLAAGCAQEFDVLETGDIDQVPALVRLTQPQGGYSPDDLLLVLVPRDPLRVRVGRGPAAVLAVRPAGRKWQAPASGQAATLDSIFYRFLYASELRSGSRSVPRDLGPRVDLRGGANLSWLRVGVGDERVNIEAAFATSPVTVRKVSYRADENGGVVLLENGSTLKVR